MTLKKRPGICLLLATLWLGLIVSVSLTPSPPGAETLNDVGSWFPFPKAATRFLQAIIHGVLFGVWAILCAMIVVSVSASAPAKRILFVSIGAVVVVGIAIEIIQIWIPHRDFGLTDFLGDVVGAVLFLALSWRKRVGPFSLEVLR